MRTNPWKLASIALATATAVVVGIGFDGSAEATPQSEAIGAIGILESASRQLWRAPKDEHRQKAMESARMAIAELRMLGFPTDPAEEPDPNGKKKKR
ncbi:MAG: hypothetical protein WKG00_05485 [Polyangiaceae bacterium]